MSELKGSDLNRLSLGSVVLSADHGCAIQRYGYGWKCTHGRADHHSDPACDYRLLYVTEDSHPEPEEPAPPIGFRPAQESDAPPRFVCKRCGCVLAAANAELHHEFHLKLEFRPY